MKHLSEVNWLRYKVVILMVNYNKKDYIEQAIKSVLMQEGDIKYLLVLVDDCSKDGSKDIIMQYEKEYPEKIFTIYSEVNEGYYKSQLKVYEHMKTEYFTLLDPDDYWVSKTVLEDAIGFLDENRDYVECGFNTQIVKEGYIQNELFCRTMQEECMCDSLETFFEKGTVIPHTSASIFRNVLYQNGVPQLLREAALTLSEASFRGDTDRFIMWLKFGKMKFINRVTSVYRVYKGGIWSGSSKVTQILMTARSRCDHSDFYKQKFEDEFMNKLRIDKRNLLNCILKENYGSRECDEKKNFENFQYCMRRLLNYSSLKFDDKIIHIMWNFICKYDGEPVIIWGCGGTLEELLWKYNFTNKQIKYIVDSDKLKQGKMLHGIPIKSPLVIDGRSYVILMNMYYKENLEFIKEHDLCSEDKVINLFVYERL